MSISVGGQRDGARWTALLLRWYCVGIILYHLYAAQFGAPEVMMFRPTHVAMYTSLIFLTYALRAGRQGEPREAPWYDWALFALAWLPALYIYIDYERIVTRYPYVAGLEALDWTMGALAIALVMEACRRAVGNTMVILLGFFLVHALFGPYFPGPLNQTAISPERLIDHLFMTTSGLYGSITGISATYVLMFVLLGAMLDQARGGDLFMNLASGLMGRFRGGPGKAAIMASGLFGSISGAAVANVYATGTFTIPLMKRTGFRPNVAAAVEAVASSSGQLVPPIMGSAAFLIADFTRLQYLDVAIAAILPAFLFLFAIFVMVHLEAIRYNLPAMSADLVRKARKDIWLHIHMLLVLVVVVLMLVDRRTPFFAAYVGVVTTIILAQVRVHTRFNFTGVVDAFELGARRIAPVAAALFIAALVVGTIELSGLGLRFTSLLLALTGGHLFPTLLLVMAACIILGMGLPTSAAYMIVALFGAPALVRVGVDPLAAHMFVFYYAIISAITPPVALASYAAATIADCPMQRAGWTSMKLGAAVYIVPFVFVYHPALLFRGDWETTVIGLLTAVVGIVSLALAVQGYGTRKLNVVERAIAASAAILLLIGGWQTDLAGAVLFALVVVLHARNPKREIVATNPVTKE
ncbi:TRAP transporter permease [Pseudazoarcus pumilus]|uniref:C4-dicarboxylate ABC transporter permease n=1 Tax=Pseudazoarcus pumilus TaxID=2067960 RepID=A0A2I6S5B7_9RHOO|nr:TRAP transporter fused permease subunit [Pseudazoarcus pumilus]AUN94445.1 C4-dicarboxylate ABC transporter permease [Pseudazoarcus pumilus]